MKTDIAGGNISVSVVIPAYNAEKTLHSAIDSLLHQTLSNIEIIVVDDGSTDNTKEIISSYQKEYTNIKAIFSENKGVSAARNAGISIAKGEYVGFLDADDLFDETMLEKMYSLAIEKEAEVVQCGRREQYLHGREKIVLPNLKLFDKNLRESPRIFGHSSFIWDKIYKNSLIQENSIRLNSNILYAEENVFILQILLLSKKISAVREPLYIYSARRPGAATLSFDRRLLDNSKGIAAACDVAIQAGMFGVLENAMWGFAKGYYFRRVDDFALYSDKELQKEIVDGFFSLFDQYFWEWRKRLLPHGRIKKFFSVQKRKYVDKKRMYEYIYSPNTYKLSVKKLQGILKKYKNSIVKTVKKAKSIAKRPQKLIARVKKSYQSHKNGMRYCRYLNCEIDPQAVILSANSASLFNGNIYYIAKNILENRPEMKVYVVSNNIKRDFIFSLTEGICPHFIKSHSEEHIRLLATAKFLVTNTKMPTFFIKRPGQVYMNTWHGTPLKTLGKSMHSGKRDMALNQKEFFAADYLLYPSEFMQEKMMEDFELKKLYRGKVALTGYPRNGVFFDRTSSEHIRGLFGLTGKKVYVYMPTWRGESTNSVVIEEYREILENILTRWEEELNQNIIVYVKLHPYVMKKIKIGKYSKIRPFPENYETYLFLNAADGLITDYSSVFFDFANSKKEILLFTYDKMEYMSTRGLYFDIDELPFPQFDQIEDLVKYMNREEQFRVTTAYENFLEHFCKYDSLETPQVVSDCLIDNLMNDKNGRIIDYTEKHDNGFRIVFMPGLTSEKNKELFEQLTQTAGEDTIFAFFMNDVTNETDQVLNSVKDEKFGYIIVPGEMVMSAVEAAKLFMYRKCHIFKRTAKWVYLREMQRVFPNIHIKTFENYSNREKFKDMTALFATDTLK